MGCVLSPVIALITGCRLLLATLRGCAIVGEVGVGAVFSENSANFWENVQQSGFETGTVVKMGPFIPLGHNILEYLLNDA